MSTDTSNQETNNAAPPAEGATPNAAENQDKGAAGAPVDPAAPEGGAASSEGGAGDSVDPPAPPGGASAEGEGGEKSPAPANDDWKKKRYDTVYAKLKEAEAKLAKQPQGGEKPAGEATDDSRQREIREEAERLAAAQDFNRRCNNVANEGKKKFSDFNDRIGNLQHLYTPGNASEEAAYARMLEAALETDEPERVLYELGGDMDMAERMMGLSPVKMGMEMAKIAAKKGEAEPSNAPRPIKPVGDRGTSATEIDPADPARADNLSKDTWFKRRQADIDRRRAAGERIW